MVQDQKLDQKNYMVKLTGKSFRSIVTLKSTVPRN